MGENLHVGFRLAALEVLLLRGISGIATFSNILHFSHIMRLLC